MRQLNKVEGPLQIRNGDFENSTNDFKIVPILKLHIAILGLFFLHFGNCIFVTLSNLNGPHVTRNQDFSYFFIVILGNYLGNKWPIGAYHMLIFKFSYKKSNFRF